jgi:hypothetical protein
MMITFVFNPTYYNRYENKSYFRESIFIIHFLKSILCVWKQ